MPPRLDIVTAAAELRAGSEQARDRLAAAVLAFAEVFVQQYEISVATRQDLAQEISIKALRYLESGSVTPGKEKSYLWRVAKSVAMSHFRKKTPEVLATPSQRPITQLPPRSHEQHLAEKQLVSRLIELLEHAPAAYREILIQHYLDDVSLAEITEREVQAMPPGETDSWSKARQRVDKRLSRARQWLRAKIASAEAVEAG